jgi:hypothetical protein
MTGRNRKEQEEKDETDRKEQDEKDRKEQEEKDRKEKEEKDRKEQADDHELDTSETDFDVTNVSPGDMKPELKELKPRKRRPRGKLTVRKKRNKVPSKKPKAKTTAAKVANNSKSAGKSASDVPEKPVKLKKQSSAKTKKGWMLVLVKIDQFDSYFKCV